MSEEGDNVFPGMKRQRSDSDDGNGQPNKKKADDRTAAMSKSKGSTTIPIFLKSKFFCVSLRKKF